jgi:monoamine oxidase
VAHERQQSDVVVVGAGFAGVTAARELAAAGYQVMLLEARDRVGGRTWTTSMADSLIELGGAWIHWRQPHIWAEVTRYGLMVTEHDWEYDAALFGDPPRPHDASYAFAKVRALFERYICDAQAVIPRPHEPLRRLDVARFWDHKSIRTRLDELALSPGDEEWLSGLLYEIAGSPLDEAGFFGIARWMALCEWNIDFWYDTNKVRPTGGTIRLLDSMLADGRIDVRLSWPVAGIMQDEERVGVHTAGGQHILAQAAVVAVPVNVWPEIDFTPRLEPDRLAIAQKGVGKPQQDKVWIRLRGAKLGRIFAQLPAGLPLGLFWTYSVDGSTQLMMALNSSPDLDVEDGSAVASLIRSYVPGIDEVLDVRGHSWSRDPYSRGGNSFFRTGDTTTYLNSLQEPWGRLAFASADVASGWVGYIDGAVESGLRAAAQIRARLGSRRTQSAGETLPPAAES